MMTSTNPTPATKIGGSRRRRLRRDERRAEHLAGYRAVFLIEAWNRFLAEPTTAWVHARPDIAGEAALKLLDVLEAVTMDDGRKVSVHRHGLLARFILACFIEPGPGDSVEPEPSGKDVRWIWRSVEWSS